HLYSIDPDGSGLTQLTSGSAIDQAVSVLPGSSRIAFARDTLESCGHLYWAQGVDLFVASGDGTQVKRITNNCPVDDSSPAWSPSGAHIVVSRFGDLWSMRAYGSDAAKLTCTSADADYQPTWSPDGTAIAFERHRDVDVIDADGTNARFVAAGSSPSFSPDGIKLAYVGTDQGIHVVSVDGTGD